MTLCASCGSEQMGGGELCRHHALELLDGWAEGNRILCDWIHRGKLPVRMEPAFRQDEPIVLDAQ